ncbi:MAG: glycosyl hydrolase family 17 protein [Nitrosopumilus sp.]|nr:glycosyl hydrolase family 17 protein [Nitrosopumilus sp.]MDH5658854.1 glycosyl hydrolase family 17 protein [Nitrosopumilus sp.]
MSSELKLPYGICYGPHRDGQDPTQNIHPNEMEMNQDVAFLSTLTKRIRIYSSHGMSDMIKNLDKNKVKVNLGVSLDANSPTNSSIEINKAKDILAKYGDLIDCITVGNEVLAKIIWDSHLDLGNVSSVIKNQIDEIKITKIIPSIDDLKKAVAQSNNKDIRVTTAEPWRLWQDHPDLIDAVDVITAHIHPYWDGQDISHAVDYVLQTYNAVASLGKVHGKNVIIGETGWPTHGDTIGTAIPSSDNQKMFLKKFLTTTTIPEYYIFEAFDEKWKEMYGLVEGHWGLCDSKGITKHDLSILSGAASKNNWR